MACKYQRFTLFALAALAQRPQVRYAKLCRAAIYALAGKAQRSKVANGQIKAARVVGRNRWQGNELLGKLQGVRHGLNPEKNARPLGRKKIAARAG